MAIFFFSFMAALSGHLASFAFFVIFFISDISSDIVEDIESLTGIQLLLCHELNQLSYTIWKSPLTLSVMNIWILSHFLKSQTLFFKCFIREAYSKVADAKISIKFCFR